LARHASLLTNAFNGSTARFLSDLGASRVILPRELSVAEVGRLINDVRLRGITLEYETIAINQRCPFIDGMCGFHHAVRLPSDAPAQFDYEPAQSSSPAVVWSHDPEYRGHGCQLSWQTEAGPVDLRRIEDADTPACAACLLRGLANVGVRYYKVAGRGYPGHLVARAVRFLRDALEQNNEHGFECLVRSRRIRDDYTRTFGRPCTPANCYYQQNPSAR
jgi:collagenase-like PrtC family protease